MTNNNQPQEEIHIVYKIFLILFIALVIYGPKSYYVAYHFKGGDGHIIITQKIGRFPDVMGIQSNIEQEIKKEHPDIKLPIYIDSLTQVQ